MNEISPVPLLPPYLLGVAAVFGLMTLVWLVSIRKHDVSIIDIFWGPAFLVAAITFHLHAPDASLPRQLFLGLVALWGLRLAAHIGARHNGEDYRYQAMRAKIGPSFVWRSLFRVFYLQAALVALICLPHLYIQVAPRPAQLVWSDYVALALFAIGFFFEAVGDWQLQRFRSDPANKGKVMRSGLWAYTRHPNYFGDATIWLAFFFAALASDGGFYSLPSFVLMTFFLLKVSGVGLLEKTIVHRRPEYRDYIEATPAFVPWFPKRKPGETS